MKPWCMVSRSRKEMSQRLHQHLLLVTDRRHCRASDVFGGMGVHGHLAGEDIGE